MNINVGKTDKLLRIILGLVIVIAGFYFQSWWGHYRHRSTFYCIQRQMSYICSIWHFYLQFRKEKILVKLKKD